MNPSDLSHGALTDLITQLRRRGYCISTEQCLAAQRLLIALASSGDLPDHPQKLGALLAPILCTSIEEQKLFPQMVRLWSTEGPSAPSGFRKKDSSSGPGMKKKYDSPQARSHSWIRNLFTNRPRLALAALGSLLIIFVGFVFLRDAGLFTAGNGPNNPQPGNPAGLFDLKTFLFGAAITGGILLISIVLYRFLWTFSQLQFKKGHARGKPELKFLTVEKPGDDLAHIMALRKTAQELRRHRQLDSADLNVPASVGETIRNGSTTLRYDPRKLTPEYLFLIDRQNFTDQLALLEHAVVNRLINSDVLIETFYFQDDPRLCRRDGPKERLEIKPDDALGGQEEEMSRDPRVRRQEGPAVQYFTLRELSARYPEHTLAIVSDSGAGLFNPLTGRPHRWLKKFSAWSNRALLTTESYQDDYQKRSLTEMGFSVLPAGRFGMLALGALAHNEREPDFRRGVKPLPSSLQERPHRWLDDSSPSPEAIKELCLQLRDYLGDEGYLWLSGCAVYPELDWNLTLLLRNQSADIQRLDENLRALVRLPWFRHGQMPDWLRRRLILDMPNEYENAIRQQLGSLLKSAEGHSHKFSLKFIGGLDHSNQASQEDGSEHDYVFLSFMSGFTRDRLAVMIPAEVRSLVLSNHDSAKELYLLNALVVFVLLGWLVFSVALWVLTGPGGVGLLMLGAVPALLAAIYYDALLQVLRSEKAASSAFGLEVLRWNSESWFDPSSSRTSDTPQAAGRFGAILTDGLKWVESQAGKVPSLRLRRRLGKAVVTTESEETKLDNASEFWGHPKGLGPLFFTELWERFSYYGMRSILVLYMVAPVAVGGLDFDLKHAASIYGTYTMWVYLTALPGGLIGDRVLGARLAVLLGGIISIGGYFTMIVQGTFSLYLGLTLTAIGTGLLKPNISAMVGGLYKENDVRRDSGFSIFYMGINLGAMLAPLSVGYLAQGKSFRGLLSGLGFDPATSWHWGFGLAGVGMTIGLLIYLLHAKQLAQVGNRVKQYSNVSTAGAGEKLARADWKRIAAILVFFLVTMLFWAAYEQKGASLNLFTKDLVLTEVFGISFPSSWMQSLTPLFVIFLAPIFSIAWLRMGERQPSSPAKFALGMVFIGLAYLLMVPASYLTGFGRVSPLWLVGLYFLEVIGEMCLSPVGLSTLTKLSPLKLVGIMMGVWFLAASFGNKLAGYLAGFYVNNNPVGLMKLYGGIAGGLFISAGLLALLTPGIKKLMGNVK